MSTPDVVPFRFTKDETLRLTELSEQMARLSHRRPPGWQVEWIMAWKQVTRLVNTAVLKWHERDVQANQVTHAL